MQNYLALSLQKMKSHPVFIIISSSLLSYCDFSAHSFLLLDTVSNHNYKEPIDIYSDMIKGYIYGNYGSTQKVV